MVGTWVWFWGVEELVEDCRWMREWRSGILAGTLGVRQFLWIWLIGHGGRREVVLGVVGSSRVVERRGFRWFGLFGVVASDFLFWVG